MYIVRTRYERSFGMLRIPHEALSRYTFKFINAYGSKLPTHLKFSYIPLITRSSKKERRVDALALRADERRDKLRKATGRCT